MHRPSCRRYQFPARFTCDPGAVCLTPTCSAPLSVQAEVTRAKSELAHVQRRLAQAAEVGAHLKEAETRALSAENALEELRARLGEVHRLTAPQPLPTLGVRCSCFPVSEPPGCFFTPRDSDALHTRTGSPLSLLFWTRSNRRARCTRSVGHGTSGCPT